MYLYVIIHVANNIDINVKDNKLNSNKTVPTPYLFLWRQIGDFLMIVHVLHTYLM